MNLTLESCYCRWSNVRPHQTKHQEHLISDDQNSPGEIFKETHSL